MAGWDIYGKMKGKQLHQLWQLDTSKSPQTDFTIGIDTIDQMVSKMKEKPWPIYKIKVGVSDDIEMVAALHLHISISSVANIWEISKID
jgi:L-alanine-DL-glutamate epimerase-like enolase superfamily enzyme